MKVKVLLSIAVALLGGSVVFLFASDRSSNVRKKRQARMVRISSSGSGNVGGMASNIDVRSREHIDKLAMKRKLQLLEKRLGALESSDRSGGNSDSAESSLTKTTKAWNPSDLKNFMDEQFDIEEVDPHWSEQTVASITQALKAPQFGSVILEDAACKTTFCRVNLAFDTPEDAGRLLSEIDRAKPFSEGAAFVHSEGPRDQVTYFFAREGLGLPK